MCTIYDFVRCMMGFVMRVRPRVLFAVVAFMLTLSAHTVAAPPALLTDGNPQNPANWEALPTLYSGSDHLTRAEYETVNGQQTLVQANYLRDWTENQWYRNGVAQPGLNLNEPWPKQVSELDLLSASSTGSVTIRLHWISAEAAPDSVRVRVHSIARAMVGPNGTFAANNGLNSATNQTNDGDWFTLLCNAPELRTLKVTDGIAEIVLQKSATASMACAAGSHLGDIVFAGAKGGYCEVDNRYVFINLNGTQFEAQPAGNVASVATPRTKNPHHNVFEEDTYHTFTYDLANRVPIQLKFDSADSNSATYTVALPTSAQHLLDNAQLARFYHEYSFVGIASSQQIPPEAYEWASSFDIGPGPAGELPDAYGSWAIPYYTEEREFNYLVEYSNTGSTQRNVIFHTLAPCSEDVTLSYKWSDGVFGIAKRTVNFIAPRVDVLSSEVIRSEQDLAIPLLFPARGLEVPAGIALESARFDPSGYDLTAMSTISGLLGAASSATFWDQPVSRALALAAALSLAVSATNTDTANADVLRVDHEANFTWWTYNRFTYETEPPGFNANDWSWRVYLRPQLLSKRVAYDEYDMNGFRRRNVDWQKKQQSSLRARRLYYFTLVDEELPGDPTPFGGG